MQQPSLEIRDIHLPEAVSWWPPAPGYWILLLLLVVILLLGFYLFKRYRAQAVKREAMKNLKAIEQAFQQHHDVALLSRELSALLRRAAISTYPRNHCASLTGDAWLKWLDEGLKNTASRFSDSAGQLLLSAPYQPTTDIDQSAALLSLCKQWVQNLPHPVKQPTGDVA